jgi:hypothetical protein
MSAKWVFPEVRPFQVQGRDLSEDNFAQEERSNLEILIREVLQNPLDARSPDNSGPVQVRISVLQPEKVDLDYLAKLLDVEYSSRLEASGGEPLPEFSKSQILVLEDFGTTGLLGNWNDQNIDGPNENWNAFWFREGEGAKATPGSNGRAGQGKITYYRIGAARAVFGLTIRSSDRAQLLMGRSAFRKVYPFNNSKYLRHSFWCTGKDHPLPITTDDEIRTFRKAFHLTRVSEPGLSLVIPFPTDFDPKATMRTIITEFYYPIAKGNLEVTIGGMTINAASVDQLANNVLPDNVAREKKSSFTKGFRELARNVITTAKNGAIPLDVKTGWDKSSTLKEEYFENGVLDEFRKSIENGKSVSVRFPISVKPKKGSAIQSWFDVHLEVPEDLDRVEEAYIRRDLLIGSENHLASSAYLQKARALTIINENALSAFLADAEEPTHLKWNGSRPRLTEDYANPQATLRAVRNAAPRLLALVSNGMIKRDVKALAKYFNRPSSEGKKYGSGNTKIGNSATTTTTIPPEPVRKPFRIVTTENQVQVLPNGSAAPAPTELPISCTLEIAYEGLDLDPFKAYDPFDFDLSDTKSHEISTTGLDITNRSGNKLSFDITSPDFSITVPGFDKNIRIRARLNYTEKADGTPLSAE